MKTQDIIPVLVSIIIIILVAVLEKQSKLAAAITATMPIGATLALWIVYAANKGDGDTMAQFSVGLLIGIIPTIGFLVVAWFSARAGLKLLPLLGVSFTVWGVILGFILLLRRIIGI